MLGYVFECSFSMFMFHVFPISVMSIMILILILDIITIFILVMITKEILNLTSQKIILMCFKVTFALISICSTCLFGHACVKKEKLFYGQLDPLQTLRPVITNVLVS
jgi:hypothetical protein